MPMCLFTFAMSIYHAINFTTKPVGLMLFVQEKCEGIMLFYLVKLCDIVFIVNLWCLDQLKSLVFRPINFFSNQSSYTVFKLLQNKWTLVTRALITLSDRYRD